MDAIVAALAAQQAELSQLLSALDADGWQRPSRCDGWAVADVVVHLAQTNEMAIASAEGRLTGWLEQATGGLGPAGSVDDGAALMVARERGLSTDALEERWQSGAEGLCQTLWACDPRQRVAWVAGELSARTLATTRLAETWIHTGDIDLHGRLEPTERLWHIARLAWRTLPYAFAREGRQLSGPVAFELVGPGGDRWDFTPDEPPATLVSGEALELCLVAARRVEPAHSSLRAEGPDGDAVLHLVRTYA